MQEEPTQLTDRRPRRAASVLGSGALPGLAGRGSRPGTGAGGTRRHPGRGRRGDYPQGEAGLPQPGRRPRGSGAHRAPPGAAGLGTGPGVRRRRRRLRALGRDDAEHYADRPTPAGAAGAHDLSHPTGRPARPAGRPRRGDQGRPAAGAHARPARRAGNLRLQGSGVDRRVVPPRRAPARLRRARPSWPCWAAAPAPWRRWATSACRPKR